MTNRQCSMFVCFYHFSLIHWSTNESNDLRLYTCETTFKITLRTNRTSCECVYLVLNGVEIALISPFENILDSHQSSEKRANRGESAKKKKRNWRKTLIKWIVSALKKLNGLNRWTEHTSFVESGLKWGNYGVRICVAFAAWIARALGRHWPIRKVRNAMHFLFRSVSLRAI